MFAAAPICSPSSPRVWPGTALLPIALLPPSLLPFGRQYTTSSVRNLGRARPAAARHRSNATTTKSRPPPTNLRRKCTLALRSLSTPSGVWCATQRERHDGQLRLEDRPGVVFDLSGHHHHGEVEATLNQETD